MPSHALSVPVWRGRLVSGQMKVILTPSQVAYTKGTIHTYVFIYTNHISTRMNTCNTHSTHMGHIHTQHCTLDTLHTHAAHTLNTQTTKHTHTQHAQETHFKHKTHIGHIDFHMPFCGLLLCNPHIYTVIYSYD